MIDNKGFRANVGIILCNRNQQLFWGHRIGQADSWQFPQGGIDADESPQEAMFRELHEEVGLLPEHVKVLGQTERWLRYRLPHRLIRRNLENERTCIGQKQIWFLLKLLNDDESNIQFDRSNSPEFDGWKWVHYWTPVNKVIHFKREVYDRALTELAPTLFGEEIPPKKIDRSSRRKYRSRSLYRTNGRRNRQTQYTS